MIRVTPFIVIRESEIKEEFSRSSGPGGQNINKVETAVKLRFSVSNSQSLPASIRNRLLRLGGKRITAKGDLIIDAHRFRSRERNRQDARQRLVALIRAAAERPSIRLRTKPHAGAKRRRLDAKSRRGEVKRLRRPVS